MADRIEGITIKFTGDTTDLQRAIKNVKKESSTLYGELKAIDRELKWNPNSITLLAQKQQVLTQRVKASKDEVAKLKMEQKRLAADPSVDKSGAEWRQLEREIIKAQGQMKRAAREMVKFGGSAKLTAVSNGLTSVGKKLTNVTRNARLAAGAIAGIALVKGFERLKTLDEVETGLQKLGYQGSHLQNIMDAATNSVSGTKFALTDMSKVAQGALGSGVESKYPLDQYLGRVADLAQVAGIGVQDMGAMMNKALSKGTVDAKLLNQMNANGIPIYTLLAEHLGVTTEELQKMVRTGKVGFDDLYKATEKYNGLAQEMGTNTFSGAVTVLGQQFGLIGADFLSGAYEPIKEGVKGIVARIKELRQDGTFKEWGQAVGEAIRYFVEWFKNGEASMDGMGPKAQMLANAFGPLIKILGTLVKWFIGLPAPLKTALALFTMFGGPLLTFAGGLLKIINMVSGFIELAQAVGGVGTAITTLLGFNPVVLGIVAGVAALAAAAVLVVKNWDKIKEFFAGLWENVKQIFSAALEAIKLVITTYLTIWKTIITTIFEGIKAYFTFILNIYKTIFKTAFNLIKNYIVKPIQTGINTIKTFFNNLKTWISTKITAIRDTVKTKFQNIKDAMLAPIEKARDLIKKIIDKIKSFFDFNFKLPHIKLPHIYVSPRGWNIGDIFDGVIPSLGIDWYAKGGIFRSPKVIGVGEKGPEAVLPIEKLQEMLNGMADNIVNGMATSNMMAQATNNMGQITIPIFLYPNGPKMGEETVKMYDKYKRILG